MGGVGGAEGAVSECEGCYNIREGNAPTRLHSSGVYILDTESQWYDPDDPEARIWEIAIHFCPVCGKKLQPPLDSGANPE